MSVDRRLRDELASVLAAHLREKGDAGEFLARLKATRNELATARDADTSALTVADDCIIHIECSGDGELLQSPQDWDRYRRGIAFLLSDLSFVRSDSTTAVPPEREPPRRLARALLLVMILSLAAWPWAQQYAFLACWIISPAIWLFATFEHRRGLDDEPPFWPFESQAQWEAHEPLLARMNLPTWTDSLHFRRPMPRWRAGINRVATSALLLGALYLLTAAVWPLSVIAMSFVREQRPRRNAAIAPQ
ncbi:MAG: hypothetical protein QOF78_1911 [Phycisphaerales bacterium]|jgi:hypothetical protein|nr:hypothetical protein [Phycisphaerales bacterium]